MLLKRWFKDCEFLIIKSQFKDYAEIVGNNQRSMLKSDPTTQKKKLISDTLKEARKILEAMHRFLESIELMGKNAAFNTSVIIFKQLFPGIKACRFLINICKFTKTD